jgi:hypothetical protein
VQYLDLRLLQEHYLAYLLRMVLLVVQQMLPNQVLALLQLVLLVALA